MSRNEVLDRNNRDDILRSKFYIDDIYNIPEVMGSEALDEVDAELARRDRFLGTTTPEEVMRLEYLIAEQDRNVAAAKVAANDVGTVRGQLSPYSGGRRR